MSENKKIKTALVSVYHKDGLDEIITLDERGILAYGEPRCLNAIEENSPSLPFASVVICTRDHPESLAVCLNSFRSRVVPSFSPGNCSTNVIHRGMLWREISSRKYSRMDCALETTPLLVLTKA